jgi:hypothetical protein
MLGGKDHFAADREMASPNTHEVAREGASDARVVYVDNDPVVFRHAQARMADNENVAVVPADLRDVDDVLAQAGKLLDFSKPVGLLFVAVLHNIRDADDPAGHTFRQPSLKQSLVSSLLHKGPLAGD